MKNILLAAAIALGSISFSVPTVEAATKTTTVTVGPKGGVRVKERTVRRSGPRCYTKTVKVYRNHKTVVRKTRVCR